eukprot:3383245-Pyramimonas_sp.AAC.1
MSNTDTIGIRPSSCHLTGQSLYPSVAAQCAGPGILVVSPITGALTAPSSRRVCTITAAVPVMLGRSGGGRKKGLCRNGLLIRVKGLDGLDGVDWRDWRDWRCKKHLLAYGFAAWAYGGAMARGLGRGRPG